MQNKILSLLIAVVIGLALIPVVTSFANSLTDGVAELEVAVTGADVLPESDAIRVYWTTAPSEWSTASDKAFAETDSSFIFIGIDTGAATFTLDSSDTALIAQTYIEFDTTGLTTAQRTWETPDALATTYGFTWVDMNEVGDFNGTSIGALINLLPILYVLALVAGSVVYIRRG
ncbi:MAG: hypothetical protein EOM21_19600 [Gammaproteobacteria bacterium]|nr:hypothetical protein [Gammaproteobacteria bacterium]